ncbi:MAG: murein biosynthesis integral membrane protein MurJ [bacterium]
MSKRIVRSVSGVGLATLLSRTLGYARDAIFANLIGTGLAGDAYRAAARIPEILRDLFGEGTLSIAFIPVFTEYFTTKGEEDAWKLANIVLNLMLVSLLCVVILGVVGAPLVARIVATGFVRDADKIALTVRLMRIAFPLVMFISLAGLMMSILNARRHFALPALAPVVLNLSFIFAGIFVCPRMEEPVVGWTWAFALGGFGQMAIQIPMAVRKGMRYRPTLNWRHPGVRKMGRLLLPFLLSLSLSPINQVVSTNIASFLPEGSLTYSYFGYRLMQLPLGIFGVAIATVALPTLSRHAARGDICSLRETLSFALRFSFLLIVPSTVGLIILAEPLVRLLFARGAFLKTPNATFDTTITSAFYSLGLPALAAIKIVVPVFFALGESKSPVRATAISVLCNMALFALFAFTIKHILGLALASSLSAFLNASLLFYFLKRKVGNLGGARLLMSFAKISLGSIAMGGAMWGVMALFQGASILIKLVASLLAGGIVLMLSLLLLRAEEVKILRHLLPARASKAD